MPAHMPSTATPVRYEFKAKSLWTKVDKAQPLKNLARRFAVAVRLYSRGGRFYAPSFVGARKKSPKGKKKTARRCGRAVWVLLIRFYALAVAFLVALYLRIYSARCSFVYLSFARLSAVALTCAELIRGKNSGAFSVI